MRQECYELFGFLRICGSVPAVCIQPVNKPEAGEKKHSLSFKAKSYYLTKPQGIYLLSFPVFSNTGVDIAEKTLTMLHNLFLFHSNYFAVTGGRFLSKSEMKLCDY